jgi:integrase
MRLRLTDAAVRSFVLPADKDDGILQDDVIPGFFVRVRRGGSRTVNFQYAIGKKQRRLKLGKWPALKVAAARATAEKLHAQTTLGQDPAALKVESRLRADETLEPIARRFLTRQRAHLRPRSYRNVEHHLLTHFKLLHGMPIASIDRRAIAIRLQAIADGSGEVAANRARASLTTFFNWCIKEGIVDANPAAGTNKFAERSRDRTLLAAEIKIVWNAFDDGDYGSILKLLLLTGQRANEVAGMRWSEISLEAKLWTLPGERVKNGRQHVVPLSDPVCQIIAAQPHRINDDGSPRDLVFGRGAGPFGGWSKAKALLNARIQAATGKLLAHWQPHDLRRSAATGLAEIGIDLPIIEKILNHQSGSFAGIVAIYQRHDFRAETRRALQLWGERVMSIVENRESTIVPFQRTA